MTTNPLSANDIEALRDALAKAKPGKWYVLMRSYPNNVLVVDEDAPGRSDVVAVCGNSDDTQFIALAHNALSALLTERDTLRAALKAVSRD